MASTQRSGTDDRKQLPGPPAFAKWIADHRLITRIILIGLDVGLVALIATDLDHWPTYLQLPIYGWITWNAGWFMPKSVDDWRAASATTVNEPEAGG